MKKIAKGSFGYIRSQKVIRFVKTVLGFAAALAVFLLGYYLNHGSRRNIYTIIAVVGMIPVSMSCTGMIMMWLRRPMDRALYERVRHAAGKTTMVYELYLTTRDQNIFLDACGICRDRILAFTHEDLDQKKIRFMEEHIRKSMKAEKMNTTVKIFRDEAKFLENLEGMAKHLDPEARRLEEAQRAVLLQLSI